MAEGYLWWHPKASPGFDGWIQIVREEFETEDQAIDSEKVRLRAIGRAKRRMLESCGVHVDAIRLNFDCGLVYTPPEEGEERVWAIDHFKDKMLEYVASDAELAERLLQHQRAVHRIEPLRRTGDRADAYADGGDVYAAGDTPRRERPSASSPDSHGGAVGLGDFDDSSHSSRASTSPPAEPALALTAEVGLPRSIASAPSSSSTASSTASSASHSAHGGPSPSAMGPSPMGPSAGLAWEPIHPASHAPSGPPSAPLAAGARASLSEPAAARRIQEEWRPTNVHPTNVHPTNVHPTRLHPSSDPSEAVAAADSTGFTASVGGAPRLWVRYRVGSEIFTVNVADDEAVELGIG